VTFDFPAEVFSFLGCTRRPGWGLVVARASDAQVRAWAQAQLERLGPPSPESIERTQQLWASFGSKPLTREQARQNFAEAKKTEQQSNDGPPPTTSASNS
jgi:hypothetical protein